MVRPDRAGHRRTTSPAIRRATRRGSSNARNILARVDHVFTPNFRMSDSFYWNRRPSIRNCGERRRLHDRVQTASRSRRQNDDVHRRGVLSAHLDASRAPAVRLGDPRQPAEPLDRRLRPLVHGRQLAVGRARTGRRRCGARNQGGLLDTTAGPPVMTFGGNTPVHRRRPELAAASASWSTTAGSSRTT